MLDAEIVEVLRPRFERSPVGNPQGKMVEADCTFVERVGDPVGTLHCRPPLPDRVLRSLCS